MQNTPMLNLARRCAVLALCSFAMTVMPWHHIAAQSGGQDRHRVPAAYMSFLGADWLERDERVAEERPQRVLDAMGLEPGDVVADIGCGSGYYARKIAPLVQPGGRVYCEDIQPEMLEIMQSRAAADGVDGIEPILGTATNPMLPDGELDWVIIADVYHEMSDPGPMLAGIRQALAPGGRVALLEYRVEDGTGDSIKADHAMSVRQVLVEWQAAGFELEALHDFLPVQHLFFFRRSGDDSTSRGVTDSDLLDALSAGLVDAEAVGSGDGAVTVRIRRTGDDPVVVTLPVGTYFRSAGDTSDMIARRDGWVVLSDAEWRDWSVRAVGRQSDRDAPGDAEQLEILSPSTAPSLETLMFHVQVGTYTVADSPTQYVPLTLGVEQAAVWIADADLRYDAMADAVADERMPLQYAAAFALVFVDRAGIEVTGRRVWQDRETIFERLQDRGLNAWYRLKTAN